MDKTSKKIIKYLSERPDCMLMYFDDPFVSIGIPEDEFYRCVRYLAENHLVEFITNQNGIHLGIQLTHEAVHAKEFNRSDKYNAFKKWLFYSYIGGVITGVTVTLLTQFLSVHGPELVSKLCSLSGNP